MGSPDNVSSLKVVESKKAHFSRIIQFDFSSEKPNIFFTTDGTELALWDVRNLDKRLISFKKSSIREAQFFLTSNINIIYLDYHKVQILNLYRYVGANPRNNEEMGVDSERPNSFSYSGHTECPFVFRQKKSQNGDNLIVSIDDMRNSLHVWSLSSHFIDRQY